jgi:hypothetical protein
MCLQAQNKTSLACLTYCPCVTPCDLTTCYSIESDRLISACETETRQTAFKPCFQLPLAPLHVGDGGDGSHPHPRAVRIPQRICPGPSAPRRSLVGTIWAIGERRFRVYEYKEAPGFRPGCRKRVTVRVCTEEPGFRPAPRLCAQNNILAVDQARLQLLSNCKISIENVGPVPRVGRLLYNGWGGWACGGGCGGRRRL